MTNKNHNLGYIYITLCVLINSYAFVFISHMVRNHNEFLSLAMVFGYATILFTLVNIKKLPLLWGRVKNNFKALSLLNLVSFLSWLGAFISLKYIDPATKLALGFGIIAITNFFIKTPISEWFANKRLITCLLLVFISMVLIVTQYAAINVHLHPHTIYLGLGWAIFAGITGGFIGVYSEKVGHAGFTPTQILATRFYMLVLASIIILVFTKPALPAHLDWHYYLLGSVIIVLLPLLLYQTTIQHLGSVITALFESFTPVVTYFMQIAVSHYRFHLTTFLLLLFANLMILWLVRVESKKSKG